MLNKVIIIGRLVRNPAIRYLPSGSMVAEFSIAYNRSYMVGKDKKEESHFFDVKAYGKLAEGIEQRLAKGYTVMIEGRLSQDRWSDKDGKMQSRVRIVAERVRIIAKPQKGEPTEVDPLKEEDITQEFPDDAFNREGDDEIPF